VQDGTLFAHGFDPATATLSGEPIAMIEHVAAVSASSSGRRADGRELFYLTPEGQLMAVPIAQ
jgi:hypothetical protein